MKKSKRRLVTERTVRDAARAGRPIETGDDALVTPSARDLARQLGVPLGGAAPAVAPETGFEPAAMNGHAMSPIVSPVPAEQRSKTISIGSDHGGFKLKEALKPLLAELGMSVTDVGCGSTEPVDYPVFAARVADLVSTGEATFGIMVDGAGIGSAMVGNKIRGVRAASCHDVTTAKNAREHNNANFLSLGGGLIGERLAAEIVRVFLSTDFAAGRHLPRVGMIDALDR